MGVALPVSAPISGRDKCPTYGADLSLGENQNIMNRVRLISVTREGWGVELRKSLSALTNALLPKNGERQRYWFTGKMRPNLEPNNVLVFRFEGMLLGEGAFLGWNEKDDKCMLYRPIRQYRERVVGSEFFEAGQNPYPILDDATIRAIRNAALKLTTGPYPKTGERESLTMHRIGQGKVREAALERYETRCCLCRIDEPGLLVAGHIRGWAKGTKSRSNPGNVVLMCALHDSLFGRGFITLGPKTYDVRVSKRLSQGAAKQIQQFTSKFRDPSSCRRASITPHCRRS